MPWCESSTGRPGRPCGNPRCALPVAAPRRRRRAAR
jgi:hypothetical protein